MADWHLNDGVAGAVCIFAGSEDAAPTRTLNSALAKIDLDKYGSKEGRERLLSRYHDRSEGAWIQVALAPCSPFSVTKRLMREQFGVDLDAVLALMMFGLPMDLYAGIGMILLTVGIIFLIVWGVRNLTAEKLKTWGIGLAVGGALAVLLVDDDPDCRMLIRDAIDGRPRGHLRKFGLSRVRVRELAHRRRPLEQHLKLVQAMTEKHADRLLLSHDNGWYWVGQENGGKVRDFNHLSDVFLPAFRKAGASEARIPIRSLASRFESGSSMRNAFGLRMIARPIATRCRWPPESCAGLRSRSSSSPRSTDTSSTR